MEIDSKKAKPAYITWSTFVRFVAYLREHRHALPPRIDRGLMQNMSGSAQAGMISTMRFLGLIDAEDAPTQQLQAYVNASEAEDPSILKQILEASYPFLTDGSFDITNATTRQVEEIMRSYGISGSTVDKAFAFFLSACKEAGYAVSPHLKPIRKSRSASVQKNTKRAKKPPQLPADHDTDTHELSHGQRKQVKKIDIPLTGNRSGSLIIPDDVSPSEWEMLKTMFVTYGDAYVTNLQKGYEDDD